MSRRAWKTAFLALHAGALLTKTGAASCGNDVGKARGDRMVMHCQRVNTSTQVSCPFLDCSTLSSVVQAFCANPKARPTLCGEYPALVVAKPTGIPPDLERIAATAAEDRQIAVPGVATVREISTLVTSLAANVKSQKTTVDAEQQSFNQRSTAATGAHQRYKAAVASKSAARLAEAPKLLEAARSEFGAAAVIGESLLKHTAELRDSQHKLTASVRGGDVITQAINQYARDATNAGLVMDDALRSGALAHADADAMAKVKTLRDQATEAGKDAAKAATEATQLARKAHALAEMGPTYNVREAESRASADDEALKKKVDEVKKTLAGLSGTSSNLCDKPMLERSWKASARPTPAHGEGIVPVVLHAVDVKALGKACPFLKTTLGVSDAASGPAASGASPNVDVGFVPFSDLNLEVLVLVESGPKCDARGCGHTFFVNEGGGFIAASGPIVTPGLVGFARKGVDIFAMLPQAEWKLRRTPGKPPEFVMLRAR